MLWIIENLENVVQWTFDHWLKSTPAGLGDGRKQVRLGSVWPDWAIYYPLGNFLKPLATINLPKFPTFLGNYCKDVKIYHFSSGIIFVQLS